jgi:hypothetical protein
MQGNRGNLTQLHFLSRSIAVCEDSETGKELESDVFLKKSQPANPPIACGEILPTSTDINAKQYCRFFKKLNPPFCHCNHILHSVCSDVLSQTDDTSVMVHITFELCDRLSLSVIFALLPTMCAALT